MSTKIQLIIALVLVFVAAYTADVQPAGAAPKQQTVPAEVSFGFVQDANDPQQLIAVAYPSIASDNVTISTAAFSFLLPTGTVTDPAIPIAPKSGSFANITGTWTAMMITPSLYASVGFNAAELEGYDVYQLVLSPGSATPSFRAGEPIHLFSFRLPNNCEGAAVQLLANDSPIQQALLANLSANFNNQLSVSIDNMPARDLYTSGNVNGFSIACPLGAAEQVSRFFLPFVKR